MMLKKMERSPTRLAQSAPTNRSRFFDYTPMYPVIGLCPFQSTKDFEELVPRPKVQNRTDRSEPL
jgi:hypothetical protein